MDAGRVSIGHDMTVVCRHVNGGERGAINLGVTYRKAAHSDIRAGGEVEGVTT